MSGPARRRSRLASSLAIALGVSLAAAARGQEPPPKSPLSPTLEAGAPARTSGKATIRVEPIEPPVNSFDPSRPAFPVGPLAPAAPSPRGAVPVFVNPAVQGLTKGKPPPPGGTEAAATERPERADGPDWRVSHAPPDPAFGAYQRGLYVTALREALDATARDPTNAAAMTLIGEIYRDGLTGRQNWIEAARWYRLADERGDPQAAFALARAHIEGTGVEQDLKKAQHYFERAAAKNHPAALYNLGVMAIEGEIQDFKKAASLFTRAMQLGDLDATYALAFFYRTAKGVERDEETATRLLKQAADQHHLPAMVDYAIALFNGRGTKADEQGAAAYLLRAAWRNAPVAQNRLARMYAAGRGVKLDLVEAMKWHTIARANGLQDEWLDARLPELTSSQREIVEEAVRKFAVR